MFGHREVYANIDKELSLSINGAIKKYNVGTFLVGGDGQFDRLAAAAVRKAKEKYPFVRLILVRPYWTKELQNNKEYYYENYDDIIIPEELLETYYLSAITMRNKWMVDHSICVIEYTTRESGGAYNAVEYAEKRGKKIISVIAAEYVI